MVFLLKWLKVWSHPELKGLKTKKIYEIGLIDDTLVEAAEVVELAEVVDEELVTTGCCF
jgi:hypothetical protein